MKKGVIIGKFMPVHKGHQALIDFAVDLCDKLVILICYHPDEPITGALRKNWLKEIYNENPKVQVIDYLYDPLILPDSSNSSRVYSRMWAEAIKTILPDINIIFSSEKYGDYIAEYLEIEHISFDSARNLFPISASLIRNHPFSYWNYIPPIVSSYFTLKIFILGSESTGKSTLAKNLSEKYNASLVLEVGRDIVEHTNDCTYEDLKLIAVSHARAILKELKNGNKLLICDTDINITKSYSRFLFVKELNVEDWINSANKSNMYLYLETDCPFVQDGTRLTEKEREALNKSHKEQLAASGIHYKVINGSWEERFNSASYYIDNLIRMHS